MSIFFAEILHAGRVAIDMKHVKRYFRLKALVRSPRVDLRVGPRPKLFFFRNMVMFHIKSELTTHEATW